MGGCILLQFTFPVCQAVRKGGSNVRWVLGYSSLPYPSFPIHPSTDQPQREDEKLGEFHAIIVKLILIFPGTYSH